MEFLKELLESKWSGEVKTHWDAPEGLFTKSAGEIASVLKDNSKSLKQAMSRLNFYINRSGDNLSSKDHARLEKAKAELEKMYTKV